ncbi:UDP-2,3-diacylglucosamine diphosphatase LpxI [Paracoccus sp. MC1854]|uniref:LpxI family protein n=1 Tax=Paracoccus sp. MC1854 TaxID=2760306 RepID=UPI0015FF6AA1|nr:UDP-2,3-diacylglucosamine diphosphatase LpxI [Paracoccus sp. MC1854]MBB1491411.1 UDP-2,3-diacylglucosamine diphosphatase LpxI [Paracoccus sp. MC1854]
MTGRTAIIAGEGALPGLLAEALDAPLVYAMEGFAPPIPATSFRLERLVPFLYGLADEGVTCVVFAGAIRRPRLDPEAFDPRTATLVPRFLAAMQAGDDGALRELIAIFEEWDFEVVGVTAIRPDLVPGPGVLVGEPSEADRADAARAAEILRVTGPLDIGQGCVVVQGLCLAFETLPGTEAMLDFAAAHQGLRPVAAGGRGVLYKAPKPMQDRRIDLPAIGPDTVAQAARAGLAGIAWEARGVMLLEREAAIDAAEAAGLFLWARE